MRLYFLQLLMLIMSCNISNAIEIKDTTVYNFREVVKSDANQNRSFYVSKSNSLILSQRHIDANNNYEVVYELLQSDDGVNWETAFQKQNISNDDWYQFLLIDTQTYVIRQNDSIVHISSK